MQTTEIYLKPSPMYLGMFNPLQGTEMSRFMFVRNSFTKFKSYSHHPCQLPEMGPAHPCFSFGLELERLKALTWISLGLTILGCVQLTKGDQEKGPKASKDSLMRIPYHCLTKNQYTILYKWYCFIYLTKLLFT